jgi:hypothetical protein
MHAKGLKMDEEVSTAALNDKAEELLVQLGARPEQVETKLDIINPGLIDAPTVTLEQSDAWLNSLAANTHLAPDPQQSPTSANPETPNLWMGNDESQNLTLPSTGGMPEIVMEKTNQHDLPTAPSLGRLKAIETGASRAPAANPISQMLHIPPIPPRTVAEQEQVWRMARLLICLLLLLGIGIFWLTRSMPTTLPQSAYVATPASTSTVAIQHTPTVRANQSIPTTGPTKLPQQKTPIPTPTKETAPEPAGQAAPTPTTAPIPTMVPTAAPTTPPPPVVLSKISFEDGTLDGWSHTDPDGTVQSLQNAAGVAYDGSRSLMVSWNSNDEKNYPTFGSDNVPTTLSAGQTVTGYILKTKGTHVEASLYIADQTGTWFKSPNDSDTTYVSNNQTWYAVSYTIPSNIQGPVTHVGIILFGYNATVYLDSFNW